jgi:hypothetical protein
MAEVNRKTCLLMGPAWMVMHQVTYDDPIGKKEEGVGMWHRALFSQMTRRGPWENASLSPRLTGEKFQKNLEGSHNSSRLGVHVPCYPPPRHGTVAGGKA